MFEAGHRPYLAVHPEFGGGTDPRNIIVDLHLQNHSTTPAIVKGFEATLRIGDRLIAEERAGTAVKR